MGIEILAVDGLVLLLLLNVHGRFGGQYGGHSGGVSGGNSGVHSGRHAGRHTRGKRGSWTGLLCGIDLENTP